VSVRLRLQRKGAKHMAFYRIVAADQRFPRDGRFIEQLGYYDPLRDPPDIKVDTPKVIDWLSKGAQPSHTVESLLRQVGIMQMWHEVKRGKPVEELSHIEDEARKRMEAKASMEKRRKEDARAKKAAKKEEPADEPSEAVPAAPEETAEAAVEEPEKAQTEAATDESKSEPQASEAEAPANEPEVAEAETADAKDAATDSGGGASQEEGSEEAPTGSESAGDEASAGPEEKPE